MSVHTFDPVLPCPQLCTFGWPCPSPFTPQTQTLNIIQKFKVKIRLYIYCLSNHILSTVKWTVKSYISFFVAHNGKTLASELNTSIHMSFNPDQIQISNSRGLLIYVCFIKSGKSEVWFIKLENLVYQNNPFIIICSHTMGHLSIQHTKLNQVIITKQIFRVFQIAVKGRGGGGGQFCPVGEGNWTFCWGDFLPGGENLRRSGFENSKLF